MHMNRKPLLGAILLALFITSCLGWLFHGEGQTFPIWGYPLAFVAFAGLLYAIASLLQGARRAGIRARSVDISIEI
jgi:hypothetical protein